MGTKSGSVPNNLCLFLFTKKIFGKLNPSNFGLQGEDVHKIRQCLISSVPTFFSFKMRKRLGNGQNQSILGSKCVSAPHFLEVKHYKTIRIFDAKSKRVWLDLCPHYSHSKWQKKNIFLKPVLAQNNSVPSLFLKTIIKTFLHFKTIYHQLFHQIREHLVVFVPTLFSLIFQTN